MNTERSGVVLIPILLTFVVLGVISYLVYYNFRSGEQLPTSGDSTTTSTPTPVKSPTPTKLVLGPNETDSQYWIIHQYRNTYGSGKSYTKIALPKDNNLDLEVKLYNHFDKVSEYDTGMIFESKTIDNCTFNSASGGIGRGGGDGKYVFEDEQLGARKYSMYAWSWDSTIASNNRDNLDFRINFHSIGSSESMFDSCVKFIKGVLKEIEVTSVSGEYVDQYYSNSFE